MIQFNLLPDVKLSFVKANRQKHTISLVSMIVAAVSLFILVLLFLTVDVVQKNHESNLNNQINNLTSSVQSIHNLNQILTLQSDVNALPTLNTAKPVVTRLPAYIAEVTPNNITISNFATNFVASTTSSSGSADSMTITGSAPNLASVNQFIDTLKQCKYQTSSKSTQKDAFSNVLLSSFQYSSQEGATYTINASFDPAIFSSTNPNVSLVIPVNSTTRSAAESTVLFYTNPSAPAASASTSTTTGQGN
jgi:hypothetical protein